MNNCLRCIQTGRNYLKIYISERVYLQKSYKSTGNNKDGTSSSESSSSSSDSDDPKSQIDKPNNEEKIKKLNELLMQLIQQDTVIQESKINLAHPPNKRKEDKAKEVNQVENHDQEVVRAVKEVADKIGGDTKSTETELLMKLLSPEETTPKNLIDIIKDMKIDREKTFSDKTRAEHVKSLLQRSDRKVESRNEVQGNQTRTIPLPQPKQVKPIQKIDLFGAQRLGIFTNPLELKESVQTKTWSNLQNRDLKLSVTHPPANYFQQMILWTEQGKLWKFPIDNEQGLDDEKRVHFTEHVFLEEHLEPWCPQKGPIRHFMELVCVGLSKNSYLTVKAKKDHIEWFQNYFESKKDLLKEVGAIQDR